MLYPVILNNAFIYQHQDTCRRIHQQIRWVLKHPPNNISTSQLLNVFSEQLTVISALAEVGYKKTLRKMFLDPTVRFHPDAIMRRCERFADEKKISALETIAECAKDVRHVDTQGIYDMILDILRKFLCCFYIMYQFIEFRFIYFCS